MSKFNREDFKKSIEEFVCKWKPKETWFYTDLKVSDEIREEIRKFNSE